MSVGRLYERFSESFWSAPYPRLKTVIRVCRPLFEGGAVYFLTSLIVVLGVDFASAFIPFHQGNPPGIVYSDRPLAGFLAWDAQSYCRIAEKGYSYHSNQVSTVAYFPAYPLAISTVRRLSGVSVEIAAVLVANAAALLAFVLFSVYLSRRSPQLEDKARLLTLAICGIFPTTFFWRMGYSESIFLALALLFFLCLIGRRLFWAALVVGVLSATRVPGIVLIVPLAMALWSQGARGWRLLGKLMVMLPLSVSGLLAFMAFQWYRFDEPLAFIKAQSVWNARPVPGVGSMALNLLTLEPVRATYDSAAGPLYWGAVPPTGTPEFNLLFWTPLFLGVVVVSVWIGWKKGILSSTEAVAGLLLCVFPYCAQGPRAGMFSVARYCSVAFPVYIVLGKGLSKLPAALIGMIFSVLAVMLFAWSALFAAWYWIY